MSFFRAVVALSIRLPQELQLPRRAHDPTNGRDTPPTLWVVSKCALREQRYFRTSTVFHASCI